METGFPDIDASHRLLADYLGYLDKAISEGNKGFIAPMLEEIIQLLEIHFPKEEALMREHKYPLLDQHMRVHQSFIKQLRRYEERHAKGEDISRKISYDLKIWLTNHIKLQDGDFAKYAKKRSSGGWLSRILR